MENKKTIFVLIGSASRHSSNEKLIDYITKLTADFFCLTVLKDLKTLPPFDPERSANNPPNEIVAVRDNIERADGVLICTPEYIFSIPSGLKNVVEWCVSTTVFSAKPVGLITASAQGEKGHEELQLIMKTVMATFIPDTTLLIQGIKGKINEQGELTDSETKGSLTKFIAAFRYLTENAHR